MHNKNKKGSDIMTMVINNKLIIVLIVMGAVMVVSHRTTSNNIIIGVIGKSRAPPISDSTTNKR